MEPLAILSNITGTTCTLLFLSGKKASISGDFIVDSNLNPISLMGIEGCPIVEIEYDSTSSIECATIPSTPLKFASKKISELEQISPLQRDLMVFEIHTFRDIKKDENSLFVSAAVKIIEKLVSLGTSHS